MLNLKRLAAGLSLACAVALLGGCYYAPAPDYAYAEPGYGYAPGYYAPAYGYPYGGGASIWIGGGHGWHHDRD